MLTPRRRLFSPLILPIALFLAAMTAGAFLLRLPWCLTGEPLSWADAFFTAASAVCVTGLVVQDTGSFFSQQGQTVILALIQLGGLGVMTYTSLAMILWRRRVSLTDRIAVGQSLLHDPTFSLGRFLLLLCAGMAVTELAGAALLLVFAPEMGAYSALFHSVSALCNAGFSLYADSLTAWSGDVPVNLVFMFLIVLGGLGFSAVMETVRWLWERARRRPCGEQVCRLSLHARVVWGATAGLIVGGTLLLFLGELFEPGTRAEFGLLEALFQSVTARTAGFNTAPIGELGNLSLLFLMALMFVGGSPGSCAGGIKTTTFRVLAAFVGSQMQGRSQTVLHHRALDGVTVGRAFSLLIFALGLVAAGTLALCVTEWQADQLDRGLFMHALFESVSAFGTVGLSTGLTPTLSTGGKLVLIPLMLLGRIGPIVFLGVIQDLQSPPRYAWPEQSLMIG